MTDIISDENISQESDEDHRDNWDDTLLIQAWNQSWTKMKKSIANDINIPLINKKNKIKKSNNRKYEKQKQTKQEKKTISWHIDDLCIAIWEEDGYEYIAKILSIDDDKGCCNVIFLEYGNEDKVYLNKLKAVKESVSKNNDEKMKISEDVLNDIDAIDQSISSSSISLSAHLSSNNKTLNTLDDSKDKNCFNPSMMKKEVNNDDYESDKSSCAHSIENPLNTLNTGPQNLHFNNGLLNHNSVSNSDSNTTFNTFPPFHFNPLLNPNPGSANKNEDSNILDDNEALAQMLISWYMTGYHTGFYQGITQAKNANHKTQHVNFNTSNKKKEF
ncbi:survival motor neuron protein-like [Gordionus sp. m RMFG-2023]|uniref:survival motor neuron protein-like n=1 Tax=Gordionus sp. m RMFG-2023 TaxID=3053472 RepID=UPI0031FD0386